MTLYVGGGADMFERRVRDFIKSEFLSELKKMIRSVPSPFHPKRIALRDTTSRWGSCSSTGTMSFSWRLAFAPVDVMRYVVMHELAHTKHMNHSDEFWMTVRELYGPGVERAKRWLALHGGELHRYF
jgi:predicted metal-dependent hydrolase